MTNANTAIEVLVFFIIVKNIHRNIFSSFRFNKTNQKLIILYNWKKNHQKKNPDLQPYPQYLFLETDLKREIPHF